MLALKLFGYVRMARELVPPMQERGWGRVVNIPVRRVGEPEEIADVATYLCSERCTYLVGAAIPVGGGTGAVI